MRNPVGNVMRRTAKTVKDVFRDGMPTFDVDNERINVFPIGDQYFFKHYFEGDELFGELRQFYNSGAYRFEVPEDAFDEVEALLADHFYELSVVDDIEEFCVVKQKYSEHPDMLFRNAVVQRSHGDHNVFLLKDQLSVEQAVNHGAQRLSEADVELPL